MPPSNNIPAVLKRQPRWRLAAAAIGLALIAFFLLRGGRQTGGNGVTFAARKGPLDITVLEGGSIQALESQEIKCEARVGYQGTKILKIVEEGYLVTEEDIRTNKVLVELDASELDKQRVQQEIQFQSATASLTDGQQGYEIQLNQNLSDIKAAEQKARFARMDFDKYLGASTAEEIIAKLGLEQEMLAEQTNALAAVAKANSPPANGLPAPVGPETRPDGPGAAPKMAPDPGAPEVVVTLGDGPDIQPAVAPAPAVQPPAAPKVAATNPAPDATPPAEVPQPVTPLIDFSRYADISVLGDGEAKQKLRELQDTLQVAKKEEGQAKSMLEGTERLQKKDFVTKIDLERDEIAAENARLKVQKAVTAQELFLQYEFKKSAEESLSKYVEATRELTRARKAAISKLAQAEARWRSAQAQFNVQQRQLNETTEQVAKCVITAKKPGLAVYGGGGDEMFFYGDQERIREGGTVRERQSIITIPDMTKMGVKVKIHESYIKQVKKGQKVRITADAFPDKVLSGEVSKVGVLPDSQNRWMNPDLKVYLTTITIDGTTDWLKPGMTAKVEIIVDRLPEVIYVPVQAVTPQDGKQVCHVVRGGGSEPRPVEIGQFNDEFIEIKTGLKEGEKVLLRAPELAAQEGGDKAKAPAGDKAKAAAPAAAPAAAKPAGKS